MILKLQLFESQDALGIIEAGKERRVVVPQEWRCWHRVHATPQANASWSFCYDFLPRYKSMHEVDPHTRDACGDSTPKAPDGLALWPPMGFDASSLGV
ncbi:hypothetical protein KC352_g52 [Hortaea werneckii]|nr:hypothetical protein KC352_g52 [Hortaea werneckii]